MNGSKHHSGMGGSCENSWNPVDLKESTKFDGVLVRDGVLGGSQGTLHRRWEKKGPYFDSELANVMNLARFGEIERSLKL